MPTLTQIIDQNQENIKRLKEKIGSLDELYTIDEIRSKIGENIPDLFYIWQVYALLTTCPQRIRPKVELRDLIGRMKGIFPLKEKDKVIYLGLYGDGREPEKGMTLNKEYELLGKPTIYQNSGNVYLLIKNDDEGNQRSAPFSRFKPATP